MKSSFHGSTQEGDKRMSELEDKILEIMEY
jgi:hypothetical protein